MWPNPQFAGNLSTCTKEIFNRKLYFLCSVDISSYVVNYIQYVEEVLEDVSEKFTDKYMGGLSLSTHLPRFLV